ncbi:MAG TPA: DUF6101 family protein [Xanthobacteraceae bacterium]|nr:DUF6101 family protein [Xanthobacteraceae bacterium]
MVLGGVTPVGSSRGERLDPFALPVRFTALDAGADGRSRDVELTRERVVLRRAVRGMRMAVNLPVTAFLGIALRLVPAAGGAPERATISLEHRDCGLSVPLFATSDWRDAVAEWRLWGRVLKLPLLVSDRDGGLRDAFNRLGLVRLGKPGPRRRRHNAIKGRRPSILLRRSAPAVATERMVHRGEREIIARN